MAIACAVMVIALLLGRWLWPDWVGVSIFTRVWHLSALVIAGSLAYVGGLFAGGFRLRDLRAV